MEPWKYQWDNNANNRGSRGGGRFSNGGGKAPRNNASNNRNGANGAAAKNNARDLSSRQRRVLRKLLDAGTTYADAIKQARAEPAAPQEFPVAIMHSDYPGELLTEDQMKLIEKAIMSKILATEDAGSTVSFYSATHKTEEGWMVLNCADQGTHDWVIKEVPALSPWEDADLNAIDAKDMPKFHVLEAEVPDEGAGDQDVLTTLQKMNEGLKTADWKVLKRDGATVKFMIDDESIKILEDNDFKAFFGFGQITFKGEGIKQEA